MENIVLLTVHLKNKIYFLGCNQKSLPIVLSNSCVNMVVYKDLLVVSLVVFSVGMTLNDLLLQVENSHFVHFKIIIFE